MTEKTMKDQTHRLEVLSHLERHISKNNCADLTLHSEDPEMQNSFTSFDVKHTTGKAEHDADVSKPMIDATCEMKHTAWKECCDCSCQQNHNTTKCSGAFMEWHHDFTKLGKMKFRCSGGGLSSTKALSPFAENEELHNKFKPWACLKLKRLKNLSMKLC